MLAKDIGNRISIARVNAGLSMGQAAKELGVKKEFILSLEKGYSNPTATVKLALSQLYDVDPNWLMAMRPLISKEAKNRVKNLSIKNIDDRVHLEILFSSFKEQPND